MLTENEKKEVIKDYGLGPNDTGSLEVQIALLDANIKKIELHLKNNPNDKQVIKGYRKMKSQRRECLRKLEKVDPERCQLFKMKRGILQAV